MVLSCVTVVLVLFLILVGAGVALGFNSLNTREKLSSYECGYEPLGRDGLNFCFRFFVLAVVFMIFDVELVLVIYFIVLGVAGNLWFLKWMAFLFMVVVLLGLLHEVGEGSLDWSMWHCAG